ncbi:MAG: T3SS (YopN, CesT) and YbjN peptide-binding chaperone 1 [Rhodococcus sp. (in: high G+C Gram-positive bacteria)]
MSDSLEFDFDVDAAWMQFQRTLGDYVSVMRDGDALVLESRYDTTDGVPDTAACVQFYAWDLDMVRCEVPANEHLNINRVITDDQREALSALGFRVSFDSEPTAPHVDRNRSWSDDLAKKTVSVFRDIWGLPHPSFLSSRTTGRYDVPSFDVSATAPDSTVVPLCVQPKGREHLQQLVDHALEPWFGFPPDHDPDGDIPLRFVGGTAYVSVKPTEPVVEINSTLVHAVSGRTRAAELLVDLNLQLPDVMLHLVQDCIVAQVRVSGSPFVADHLLWAVRMLSHVWEQVDEKFAEDFGGRLGEPVPPTVDAEDFPDGLLELVELAAGSDEPLDLRAVLVCCSSDRDVVVSYLRISAEQEASWRGMAVAADLGDEHCDVAEADREAVNWGRTVAALREVLRSTPEQVTPVVDPSAIQLQLFETDEVAEVSDDISDDQ